MIPVAAQLPTSPEPLPATPGRGRIRTRLIESLLFLAAASSVLITLGIVGILLFESAPFFRTVPLREFLTAREWTPLFENPRYGILPLVGGTLVTTIVALFVAIPVGTITAVWLSEYAPHRVREVLKPCLELLSAVPTVVFGFFALLVVTPALKKIVPGLPVFNMLSAGLVMGVMIVPYIASLGEDAMRAVPRYLREASYAMGATRLQTAWRVIFPAALSGVSAAYVLAISRAVGETMVVAIAAGQEPVLTADPRDSAATLTAFIVQVTQGDIERGTTAYRSLFAAGVTLMVMTLFFNIAGHILRRRYREAY